MLENTCCFLKKKMQSGKFSETDGLGGPCQFHLWIVAGQSFKVAVAVEGGVGVKMNEHNKNQIQKLFVPKLKLQANQGTDLLG